MGRGCSRSTRGRMGWTRLPHKAFALSRTISQSRDAMPGVLGGGFELIRSHTSMLYRSFTYTQPFDDLTRFASLKETLGKHSCAQRAFKSGCIGLGGRK